jgi:hypothetical protein
MEKIIIALIIPLVLVAGCVQQNSEGVTPTLDNTLEITDSGETRTITQDFACAQFSDNNTVCQELEVNKGSGFVIMRFANKDSSVDYDDTNFFETSDQNFTVGYDQVFKLKINQTVSLEDTSYKIKLIWVRPCPEGIAC